VVWRSGIADPAGPAAEERSKMALSPLVRLLLWDYERGSIPYDVAFVLVLLALLLVPGGYWGDPLWVQG
jgi:hypothetical protein